MTTNFQRHLDSIYEQRATEWKRELSDMDWTGDFSIEDSKSFLEASSAKDLSNWAISVELKTRHGALKKIIDSL